MGKGLLVGVLSVVCALAAPGAAAAAYPRTPEQCAKALNCGADEINLMTMQQRLDFVRAMQRGPGARFGAQSRWRNIEGVITFFRDHRWGAPNTWVSYVDAGIVEGIERGLAIALGRGGGNFGNPGADLWASYVTRLKAGQLRSRAAHDRAWGEAEQLSTDHGVYLAVKVHNLPPSDVEQRFYDFSQLYRTIMREKAETANIVEYYGVLTGQPEVVYRSDNFVDWFTDVGNIVPARMACEMAWRFATLDIFGGIGLGIEILFTSIPDLLREYFRSTQPKPAAAPVVRRKVVVPGARSAEARKGARPDLKTLRRLAPHVTDALPVR